MPRKQGYEAEAALTIRLVELEEELATLHEDYLSKLSCDGDTERARRYYYSDEMMSIRNRLNSLANQVHTARLQSLGVHQ